MSEKEIGRTITAFVAVLLLLAAFGIRGCYRFDTRRELACNRAGGVLLKIPTTSGTASSREMCARITAPLQFEHVPIQEAR